jgi:hypothetical protein
MKFLKIALIFLGFVSPATAQFTSHYDSPDLKGGNVHISRVVLTPVLALATQLDWKSGPYDQGKPMDAESQQLEKGIFPVVAATLKGMGFSVDDTSMSPESLAGNTDLGDQVKLVQHSFAELNREIDAHRKRYETEPVSLGDAAPVLPVPEHSDAIVIVLVRDYLETKGKKFNNGLPGAHSEGGWYVDIGIVDPKTKTILYIGGCSGGSDIVKEPDKAAGRIEKSFKEFFKYNAASTALHEPKS